MSSNGVRAVLGIETAFKTVSVCLLDHNTLQLLALEELPLARGHAEALTPAIERVVQKSGLTFASVYGLAVSVGPGSFTGTRIGIAAAKALGATLKVPVWGVSALSAFAAPALRLSTSSVASVIDARNGLVYFQYHASDGTILFPASVLPIKTAVRSLRSEEVLVTGAGAEIFAQEAGWARGAGRCRPGGALDGGKFGPGRRRRWRCSIIQDSIFSSICSLLGRQRSIRARKHSHKDDAPRRYRRVSSSHHRASRWASGDG